MSIIEMLRKLQKELRDADYLSIASMLQPIIDALEGEMLNNPKAPSCGKFMTTVNGSPLLCNAIAGHEGNCSYTFQPLAGHFVQPSLPPRVVPSVEKMIQNVLPCECLKGEYQWEPQPGKPEPEKFSSHANDCPAYYRDAVTPAISQAIEAAEEAILKEISESAGIPIGEALLKNAPRKGALSRILSYARADEREKVLGIGKYELCKFHSMNDRKGPVYLCSFLKGHKGPHETFEDRQRALERANGT